MFATEIGAAQVYGYHRIPVCGARFDQGAKAGSPGAGDQHIELAKAVPRARHQSLDLRFIGDVGRDHQGNPTVRGDVMGNDLKGLRGARGQGHAYPCLGQRESGRASDA